METHFFPKHFKNSLGSSFTEDNTAVNYWHKRCETQRLQTLRSRWRFHDHHITESVTKNSRNPLSKKHYVHHFTLLIGSNLKHVGLKNWVFLAEEVQTSSRLKDSHRKWKLSKCKLYVWIGGEQIDELRIRELPEIKIFVQL